MEIGIDLDNTIIKYDQVFWMLARKMGIVEEISSGTKQDLRSLVRERPGGESKWRALQGQVYGKHIGSAEIFPGAKRFLWLCQLRGIKVVIVSHKTQYGHEDVEGTDLREAALEFLGKKDILTRGPTCLVEEVIFASTREEKIQKITESKFSWFIDDLLEVLTHARFPARTRGVHFSPGFEGLPTGLLQAKTWHDLERIILGEWSEDEKLSGAQRFSEYEVATLANVDIPGGKNSRVREAVGLTGNKYAFKGYVDDYRHNRSFSDYQASVLMWGNNIKNIPKPVKVDSELNWALFEWVPGKRIFRATDEYITASLNFIEKLHSIRLKDEFMEFPRASASILSGAEAENQLTQRLRQNSGILNMDARLTSFLEDQFRPSVSEITGWFRRESKQISCYNRILPLPRQTLSPSDFGYHNCLVKDDRRHVFLDFEYFGWDDPAKLVGDFLLHPGMTLTTAHRLRWLSGSIDIFGAEMWTRLKILWPILGLIWCMILLNSYRERFSRRLLSLSAHSTLDQSRDDCGSEVDLTRVVELHTFICNNYKEPDAFVALT